MLFLDFLAYRMFKRVFRKFLPRTSMMGALLRDFSPSPPAPPVLSDVKQDPPADLIFPARTPIEAYNRLRAQAGLTIHDAER